MAKKIHYAPCEECGSSNLRESTLPGMVACKECGKLQIATKLNVRPADLPTIEIPDGFSPEIPDYAEVMLGWRAWNIRTDHVAEMDGIYTNQPVILQSCVMKHCYWPARTEVVAMCGDKAKCEKGSKIPVNKCMCGLHSAKTREHLLTMSYPSYDPDTEDFTAIGLVKLWGRTIEGTLGWRAEFGYPQMIEVPHQAWHYAEQLEETYGVAVELANTTK